MMAGGGAYRAVSVPDCRRETSKTWCMACGSFVEVNLWPPHGRICPHCGGAIPDKLDLQPLQ